MNVAYQICVFVCETCVHNECYFFLVYPLNMLTAPDYMLEIWIWLAEIRSRKQTRWKANLKVVRFSHWVSRDQNVKSGVCQSLSSQFN